ncbi:MAG: hypothetical protein C0403_14925 [Desulfobacterium sp.]|nr:hypothetical protein [Desulfobacterium sp.]
MEKKSHGWTIEISLPGTSTADLMGKQSVRATFKLTSKAIDAISIVSTHLGIKQKSLFDQLMDDTASLSMIAHEIHSNKNQFADRIQKTYVLSRKTLSCLDAVSKKFNAPRDVLVEYSIQRLLPIIIREKEKHQKRKEILGDLTDYLQNSYALLQKAREILGEDDPVFDRIRSAVTACENSHAFVDFFVKKGEVIEEF